MRTILLLLLFGLQLLEYNQSGNLNLFGTWEKNDSFLCNKESLTDASLSGINILSSDTTIANSHWDDTCFLRTRSFLPDTKRKKQKYLPVKTKDEVSKDTVYSKVVQMPEFSGGVMKMFEYIEKNLRYPYEPFQERITVVVGFVVEKDGSLTNFRICRSADFQYYDKEALRVVKSMPKWKPGYKDGKSVRVNYSIPVWFRLR